MFFLCHDGAKRLLLHQRSLNCRDEHGRWDCGAGALEFGEEFEDAVRREVLEEYGVEARDVTHIATQNVLREHNGVPTHWIALVFTVRVDPRDVKIGEPEKMDAIGWFDAEHLPSPLHSVLHRWIAKAQAAGIL